MKKVCMILKKIMIIRMIIRLATALRSNKPKNIFMIC
jgi:hypothetical protein